MSLCGVGKLWLLKRAFLGILSVGNNNDLELRGDGKGRITVRAVACGNG